MNKTCFIIAMAFTMGSAVSGDSYAQYTESKVMNFLTADAYKLWALEDHEIVMGGSGSCIKGETYKFNSDKSLDYAECVDGKWDGSTFSFSLEEETPYDWWISFNDTKYYLVMKRTNAYHELRLRTMDDNVSKISEATDKILIHLIDD